MKKLNIVILLLLNLTCFAQEFKIPKIEFKEEFKSQNPYIKLLNLKDENTLIIKIGFQSYWYGGTSSNLIVFQNNGEVLRYDGFFPFDSLKKIKIKKKSISKSKKQKYWNFIKTVIEQNKLDIDKSQLNITRIETTEGITVLSRRTDCVDESFEISQGNQFTYLSSYDPLFNIELKHPGFEERQKFVNLITEIQNLIKK